MTKTSVTPRFYAPLYTWFKITLFTLVVFRADVAAQPILSLTPVINTGLNAPLQMVHADDGSNRIFIVQKGGAIRAYDSDFNFLSVFLTVTGITSSGERGLLSMAFHPDYENNGLFYVYYTNGSGNLELARYQVSSGDPNVADAASKVILITIPHPGASNHNGGELHFGEDGFLYLSTGDGGGGGDGSNNAQNTAVLLGKMLRFNVNTSPTPPYYTIPAGNPYNNEIYNRGLRNPFRWSFDRQTGDVWIGDVGQDAWEEITYRAAGATLGANYGWRCYEGDASFNPSGCGAPSNYVFPIHTYVITQSPASTIGGVVYRGTAYPALQGWYIGADYYSGIFYKIGPNGAGGWTIGTQTLSPTGVADFGETEDGEVYAVSLTGNSVHRVVFSGALPLSLVAFKGVPDAQVVALDWQTAAEQQVSRFEIEYSLDGHIFRYLAAVPAKNEQAGSDYRFLHTTPVAGPNFYRLKMVEMDGSFQYSNMIHVDMANKVENIANPSLITDGVLHANLPENAAYHSLELMDMNGRVVWKVKVTGQSGPMRIPMEKTAAGFYMLKLSGEAPSMVQKICVQ